MVSPKVGIWLLGKSFLRKAGYFFRRLDALAQRHNPISQGLQRRKSLHANATCDGRRSFLKELLTSLYEAFRGTGVVQVV
jgi:hypothetical protein